MGSNGSNTELIAILKKFQESKGNEDSMRKVVIEILQYHYLSEDEEIDISQPMIDKIISRLPITEIHSHAQLRMYLNEIIYNS
ncbi:MAG: hypothetical protein ABJG47_14170 [Ekhidna sp.]